MELQEEAEQTQAPTAYGMMDNRNSKFTPVEHSTKPPQAGPEACRQKINLGSTASYRSSESSWPSEEGCGDDMDNDVFCSDDVMSNEHAQQEDDKIQEQQEKIENALQNSTEEIQENDDLHSQTETANFRPDMENILSRVDQLSISGNAATNVFVPPFTGATNAGHRRSRMRYQSAQPSTRGGHEHNHGRNFWNMNRQSNASTARPPSDQNNQSLRGNRSISRGGQGFRGRRRNSYSEDARRHVTRLTDDITQALNIRVLKRDETTDNGSNPVMAIRTGSTPVESVQVWNKRNPEVVIVVNKSPIAAHLHQSLSTLPDGNCPYHRGGFSTRGGNFTQNLNQSLPSASSTPTMTRGLIGQPPGFSPQQLPQVKINNTLGAHRPGVPFPMTPGSYPTQLQVAQPQLSATPILQNQQHIPFQPVMAPQQLHLTQPQQALPIGLPAAQFFQAPPPPYMPQDDIHRLTFPLPEYRTVQPNFEIMQPGMATGQPLMANFQPNLGFTQPVGLFQPQLMPVPMQPTFEEIQPQHFPQQHFGVYQHDMMTNHADFGVKPDMAASQPIMGCVPPNLRAVVPEMAASQPNLGSMHYNMGAMPQNMVPIHPQAAFGHSDMDILQPGAVAAIQPHVATAHPDITGLPVNQPVALAPVDILPTGPEQMRFEVGLTVEQMDDRFSFTVPPELAGWSKTVSGQTNDDADGLPVQAATSSTGSLPAIISGSSDSTDGEKGLSKDSNEAIAANSDPFATTDESSASICELPDREDEPSLGSAVSSDDALPSDGQAI